MYAAPKRVPKTLKSASNGLTKLFGIPKSSFGGDTLQLLVMIVVWARCIMLLSSCVMTIDTSFMPSSSCDDSLMKTDTSFNTTGTHALLTRLVHNRHAIIILWVGQTHRHALIILWLSWVGYETMIEWWWGVCQNTRWWMERWCVFRAHKMMIAWWWIIDDVARRVFFELTRWW